jgi:hypothetical protein
VTVTTQLTFTFSNPGPCQEDSLLSATGLPRNFDMTPKSKLVGVDCAAPLILIGLHPRRTTEAAETFFELQHPKDLSGLRRAGIAVETDDEMVQEFDSEQHAGLN